MGRSGTQKWENQKLMRAHENQKTEFPKMGKIRKNPKNPKSCLEP
jgi:hypothetical protein